LALTQGCATKQTVPTTELKPVVTAVEPAVVEPVRVVEPVVAPPVPPPPPSEASRIENCAIYTVKQGDSLSRIAAMYGVTVSEIADLNLLKDKAVLRIGQQLLLPPDALKKPRAVATKSSGKSVGKTTTKPAAVPAGGEYTIQSGDSLSKIAAKFGVKVADLKSANNLTSDRIVAGKKLKIPGATPKVEDPVSAPPAEPPVPTSTNAMPAPVTPDPAAAAVAPVVPAAPTTSSVPPVSAAPATWQ
jgi:LysM repeat protein